MHILLPHPPAALNPNGNRAHYMRISAARKKARAFAAEATVKLLEQEVGCTLSHAEIPTTYRIIWNHWGTQQPDDDNVVARIKSYKDGICDALQINDKTLRLRGVDFIRDKTTAKTLTIIIE